MYDGIQRTSGQAMTSFDSDDGRQCELGPTPTLDDDDDDVDVWSPVAAAAAAAVGAVSILARFFGVLLAITRSIVVGSEDFRLCTR